MPPVDDRRLGQLDADERRRVDLVAEVVELGAGREMRGDRARRRRGRGRSARRARGGSAGSSGARAASISSRRRGQRQQPVVGADEDGGPSRDLIATARRAPPTPGSTTARWTPTGMYGIARASISAPSVTAIGPMPWVMLMICDVRRDPLHHAAADAGVVVLDAEVGEEGDRAGTWARPTLPGISARPRVDRVEQAVEVVRLGLDRDREPDRARDAARLGADADRGRRRRRSRRTPCAAEPEASTTRSPSGGSGWSSCVRVERDEVGAEPSIGPRREFWAAAKSTLPSGRGNSASRPSCDETRGHEVGLDPVAAQRLGRARPDRGDLRDVPRAAGDLVGAVRARHDQPLVAGAVDRLVGGAHDLDQRALDDLVARAPRAARRAAAPGRAGA